MFPLRDGNCKWQDLALAVSYIGWGNDHFLSVGNDHFNSGNDWEMFVFVNFQGYTIS